MDIVASCVDDYYMSQGIIYVFIKRMDNILLKYYLPFNKTYEILNLIAANAGARQIEDYPEEEDMTETFALFHRIPGNK